MMKNQTIDFYKRLLLIILIGTISITATWAQGDVTVSGQVVDEMGETVIGANVIVKGTSNGVITDVNGHFNIRVKNANKAVLSISYVGYKSQEIVLKGRKNLRVTLEADNTTLEEVTVVAYGVQKKETLTGAISAVSTDELLKSPNSSVANSLAGKITGLSSVQVSGQPGAEDPKIFVRGVGSLTESGSSPLILVDGVERSFFQMDSNEIESISVLKDASATAVFGVRGANGVVLVTTRRGKEGDAKIAVNSSFGVQTPTRTLKMADSYHYALMHNEQEHNDGRQPVFNDYMLERFKLGDEPLLYPNIEWRDYLTKKMAIQTQHNVNVSGGTSVIKYFFSVGYLFQDGLFKTFGQGSNAGYKYHRYNYRSNLDINLSKTTVLKFGLGGIVGQRNEPFDQDIWMRINRSQPFSSAGLVDGKPIRTEGKFGNIKQENPFTNYYGRGYRNQVDNTMNLDLSLTQNLDMITKGLSFEAKGAYNTMYSFSKVREGHAEVFTPFYRSSLENPTLSIDDPTFNKDVVYQLEGNNQKLAYAESVSRARNWYLEGSFRYSRKFGQHEVGGLLLYNQNKKYYPSTFIDVPTAYIGLVGRATYNFKQRYMAEFNIGYNGSENFAPGKRFGTFPALSLGYILSEEAFMKKQHVFDFLKLRASVGLVGNDNVGSERFLYLPDSYFVDRKGEDRRWRTYKYGYNFGYDISTLLQGAMEKGIGNPDVTWETALKQNYGIDMHFLNNRLKLSVDVFKERRKDILIKRKTVPLMTGLTQEMLPVVNMGEVDNKGYEIQLKWGDNIGKDVKYWIDANMSYSKNKIIYQDEVEPNESYLWRTGQSVGAVFGRVFDRFYTADDFTDVAKGVLKEDLPDPKMFVQPGDVKYCDLNNDHRIDADDEKNIGYSSRPEYTFGLNFGASYQNFYFSMNWAGAAHRSIVLSDDFRIPFMGEDRALMEYQLNDRWTEATALTAKYPRLSSSSRNNNYWTSDLWVKDGSYLKLKNLTIGYNFPKAAWMKKIGLEQLGVKFTGYNILTITPFDVMDPECSPSHYGDTYPIVKIYNIGVNFTF